MWVLGARETTLDIGANMHAAAAEGWGTFPPGTLIFSQFVVPFTGTISQGISEVQTGVAQNFRFGLWRDNNGRPGTLAHDSGSLSAAAAGMKTSTVAPIAVTRGEVLWNAYGTDGNVSLLSINVASNPALALVQYGAQSWVGQASWSFAALASNPPVGGASYGQTGFAAGPVDPLEADAVMIHRNETYDNGELVEVVEYDTDAQTVTTTPPGDTRPMTAEESAAYAAQESAQEAQANTTQMVAESDEAVDKLVLVVEALNAITDLTNAEINANPAAIIKDLARECKTIARQANREARLTSGRTESTDTGEIIDA